MGSTTDPGGLPDGSACSDNGECQSNECYVLGVLGGICGECNEDADCVGGGCTIPNALDGIPAQCNLGATGDGCETTAACAAGLSCAVIIDLPAVLTSMTCSECETDAECVGGDSCQPDYDVQTFGGVLECVGDGELGLGHGCDDTNGGDAACGSGHCATADWMGILSLGVCSACTDDADCLGASTCAPPEIDLVAGLVAGACVP